MITIDQREGLELDAGFGVGNVVSCLKNTPKKLQVNTKNSVFESFIVGLTMTMKATIHMKVHKSSELVTNVVYPLVGGWRGLETGLCLCVRPSFMYP